MLGDDPLRNVSCDVGGCTALVQFSGFGVRAKLFFFGMLELAFHPALLGYLGSGPPGFRRDRQ